LVESWFDYGDSFSAFCGEVFCIAMNKETKIDFITKTLCLKLAKNAAEKYSRVKLMN